MLKKINFTILLFLFVSIMVFSLKSYSSPLDVFSNNSLNEDEKEIIKYKNEWVKVENDYFYYGADGEMYINKWVNDENSDWYYLGADGKMQRSKWIDEKYYVDENGKMIKNTAKLIDSKTYIFNADGIGMEYIPETTQNKSIGSGVNKSNNSYIGNSTNKSIKKSNTITNNNSNSGGVWYTSNGSCYHEKYGCSGATIPYPPKSKNYRPCSKCCY